MKNVHQLADQYLKENFGSTDGNKPIRDAFIYAYELGIASLKPKQAIDLRGRFIPCTEEQVDEVCDMLDALGCLPWKSKAEAKYWGAYCEGVNVYPTNYYLTLYNDENFPTLTVDELREIYKQAKQ